MSSSKKLMFANAAAAMAFQTPGAKAPISETPPLLDISASESAVSDLQRAIAEHAKRLRERAVEGSATLADMKATAMLATSAAKLAAEEREQKANSSLALASDEDILNLLISTILSMPNNRGVELLTQALTEVTKHEPNPIE